MKIEKSDELTAGPTSGRKMIFVGVLIALVIISAIFFGKGLVYLRPPGDPLGAFLAAAYPFPAVKVGPMTVTMKDYLIEYKALENSFSSMAGQESPAPEQLQEVILETLINKRVIAKLAKDYGVEATPERVDEYYQQTLVDQNNETAFAQEIETTFGWTIDEFKKRVIEPIVLATDTNVSILSNESIQADRRVFINEARDRITKGEDFSTVAKEVMEPFGLSEYDLGYFKISSLPSDWQEAVNATAQGETTGILENENVLTIFNVTERIAVGEETQVHLLAVAVPKKTLEDLVDAYLTTVNVKRYLGT